jgi:signal transduction histidine kinase
VLEPVDVAEAVEAAIAAAEPAARAKKIELASSCSAGGVVRGDSTRLTQIASNLISNAIKFTPPGGHVEVGLRVVRDRVELEVRDDGEGIAPEHMPRLFDRFWMADASNTRAHGGLGLGLAIVRYLVERHGGLVRAESGGPGRGAVFTVTLPLANSAGTALRN